MTDKQKRLMELNGVDKLKKTDNADERIKQLEEQNEALLECLLEMSEIVYA